MISNLQLQFARDSNMESLLLKKRQLISLYHLKKALSIENRVLKRF